MTWSSVGEERRQLRVFEEAMESNHDGRQGTRKVPEAIKIAGAATAAVNPASLYGVASIPTNICIQHFGVSRYPMWLLQKAFAQRYSIYIPIHKMTFWKQYIIVMAKAVRRPRHLGSDLSTSLHTSL